MKKSNNLVDPQILTKAIKVIRALNHPVRQSILLFIDEKGTTTVEPIYTKLKLKQADTSTHLAILREANVVVQGRDGKLRPYSINKEYLDKIKPLLEKF